MKKKFSQKDDNDIEKAGEAFKRAAVKARETAKRTGTPLVIFRDGKIIKEHVTD